MGYFISRDGQQLGPITPVQVNEGLAIGALQHTDLAWTDGMTDWRPLVELFAPTPESVRTPTPLPTVTSTLPISSYSLPSAASPSTRGKSEGSSLALASLILGILSFLGFLCFITVIPALICGHMALHKIDRTGGPLTCRGKAIGGLAIAYSALFFMSFGIYGFIADHNALESKNSRSLTKVIGKMKEYAAVHQGEYPPTLETVLKGNEFADGLAKITTPPSYWTQEQGFDYLGKGLKISEAGSKVILLSRAKGPDGERMAAHNDGSVTFGPLTGQP